MNSYFLKRLLMIFPVLGIVLFMTMLLGHFAGEIPPYLYEDSRRGEFSEESIEIFKDKTGLNEPFFYFSLEAAGTSIFYYPNISWNGSKNRFHRYISNFISGNLGYSNYYKSKIWDLIKMPVLRTVFINVLVLIIVYTSALYLGYFQALNEQSTIGKILNAAGQILYAFPSFWLAILLIWLFANQQNLYLFPTSGWNWNSELGFFHALMNFAWHLVLPVLCLSLGSIIYVASIFQQKIEQETKKNYYKALIARGFSRKYILRKHILKTAIIPVIAISTDILPALISGSVIIECIFGIPGMGRLAFQAFFTKDFQVIYAITLMATILTWVNWILADFLYSKLDPRVQF